ncbi:unnamed protein product [Phytophthora lilii]|uniref:Unnamed protein product n=1 Tax=Phytophthora lilii TaxID=2077276 RepID=A0A9W6TAX4_9STRA|nr:unnamed protein product [Phytophthora lilii]
MTDTSCRSSRRGPQRSKGSRRGANSSSKSKPISSRNTNQPTPRGRNGVKSQSRVTSLPADLWTLLLPFLTWRDTSAMSCVCCEWRSVVTDAKKLHPEWRSTVIGPCANGDESLELLRTNLLEWADTRFAPDIVLISAASKDPSPWHSGGYWEEVIAAIEEEELLPRRCKIVGLFTMNAVLGGETEGDEDLMEEMPASAVTLSISVAHLPETTVEMAEFDRKDLRRHNRGGAELENPFTPLEEDNTPSFLLFGVNDQSAAQLVPVIDEWYPGAAVAGAVSPLIDRCVPLATYCGVTEASAKHQDRQRRRTRGNRQQVPSSNRRPRPRGPVAFPSTMLLRLHGNVGMKTFSSSGYHPVTPVIRCDRASVVEELSQVVTYDLVSTLGHAETEKPLQHRIMDLLDRGERLAIEQEGRGLNIFSCRESAPLEHLVNCISAVETKFPVPTSAQIDRLEFVFWLQDGLMSLPGMCWQQGAYGVLASHHPAVAPKAFAEALYNVEAASDTLNERTFGAFMVAGALNEIEDPIHAKAISKLCVDAFDEFKIGGCIVSTSVGPVAFPGCLQPPVVRKLVQVQTHTTCGAIFYSKA